MTRIEKSVEKIKEVILGKQYELSFAFISQARIKSLNNKYRQINKPTDILSFPLDKTFGEIYICKEIAKKKAPDFDKNFNDYLLFLVIHGCLHLKGLDHSSRMEKLEQKYFAQFKNK